MDSNKQQKLLFLATLFVLTTIGEGLHPTPIVLLAPKNVAKKYTYSRFAIWHPTKEQLVKSLNKRQSIQNSIEDKMGHDLIMARKANTNEDQKYWQRQYKIDSDKDSKAVDKMLRAVSRWEYHR